MTPITPAQFAQARTLVAMRNQLTHRVATAKAACDQHSLRSKRAGDALRERLQFFGFPERLAGLADLYQRNPASYRQRISYAYERLLREMITPMKPLDPELPMPPIHQVDFHGLAGAARPYLLGPYLRVHPGDRFARLCLERSRPTAGLLTIVQTGGPIDVELWRSHLPRINAWLGGSWSIHGSDASTLSLLHRAPLATSIPMQPAYLRTGNLFLGIDTARHEPAYLPFAALTSGTFVVGASGSGKSNATHLLMQSILANLQLFQAVFCIDGKEGMTFARYRNVAPGKLRILTDEPDVWALTTQLVGVIRQRNANLAILGLDQAPNNYIAVLIEEMSTYTAKPSSDGKSEANKAHARFIDELAMLARRGRSAGLRMIITAQEPTDNQIPTTVRSNCQTLIGFRVPIDAHATAAFGQLEGLPADPRKLATGQALIKRDTGTIIAVQFPVIPQPGARP